MAVITSKRALLRTLLIWAWLMAAVHAELPGSRTITFLSSPTGAEIYLENSGGQGQYLGRSGQPLTFQVPALRDAAGRALQYAPAQVTFRLAGHQPLTIRVGAQEWEGATIPGSGAITLTPANLWVSLLDHPIWFGLPVLALVAALVSRRRQQRRVEALETLQSHQGDAWIGKIVGPYRIASHLGRGGMATVYRVEKDGEELALKLIQPDGRDEVFVQRFRRECGLLAGLRHPHIVRVDDFGQQDGLLYLALELVRGRTLSEVIPDQGLDLSTALPWMLQLISALDYCHQRNLVHCDLKPDNIMVTEQGQIKLLDFGLARDFTQERLTPTGSMLGTPAYLAPERIKAPSLKPAPSVDQYSLGVVFYKMLTGETPFKAEDTASMLQLHLQAPVSPMREHRPELPERLDLLVQRMLAKAPNQRWPKLAQVAAILSHPNFHDPEADDSTIDLRELL